MTKLLYFFPVIIGCGSADADFGAQRNAAVPDAGGDARGGGGAVGAGGTSAGGAAVSTGGRVAGDSGAASPFAPGADVARCAERCASTSGATWLGTTCETDADCCYASLVCEFWVNTTDGGRSVCRQRADCTSDLDCPCNRICVTYERRTEFPSASRGKCVAPP